jgi:hypothetical protein
MFFVESLLLPDPLLALPLLVTCVGANHADYPFAANDFAILAKLFD